MLHDIWQGDKVRLRALEPDDWVAFHENDRDSEVARLCYEIPIPQSREAARQWAEAASAVVAPDDAMRLVVENRANEVVGTINTFESSRRNGTFKYGVAILRAHWGKGYATEAIQLLLRYFFLELRYQKATVHIYEFNEASLKLHAKLGFIVEGRLRQMQFSGGKHWDEYVLGITADEYNMHMKTDGHLG